MNTPANQIHRIQQKLTRSTLRPSTAQNVVEPLFTGLDAKSNEQRIAEYRERRRHHSQAHEFERFFAILNCINDCFAAEAEAAIDWAARLLIVTVDQGGKTVYSATAEMDSPAIEAKVRLIRHELEQLKVAALAGLKGVA